MMSKFVKKIILFAMFMVFSYSSVAYCSKKNNLIEIYNKFSTEDKILLAECLNKFDVGWEEYLDKAINKYDIYNKFKNSHFDENDKYITNTKKRVKDALYYKRPSHAGVLLNMIFSMIKLQYDVNTRIGEPDEYGYSSFEYGIEVFQKALDSINSVYIQEYLQGTSKALDKINEEKPDYATNVYAYSTIVKKYMQEYLKCLKLSDLDLSDDKYCIRVDYNTDKDKGKALLGDGVQYFSKYLTSVDQSADTDFMLGVYTSKNLDLEDVDVFDICDYDDIFDFIKYVQNEDFLKG